eukprot:TRINITY_DN13776_c0_g2_i1.p1 TRINITY_DN13776_c0_g2~~TRINITY_DN13776_c0_g2_i1.p1  ORF type:complete len:310 (+),score=21.98 TRINITY_DN13776_c0_g2_i1:211-1140(+)
MYSSLNPKSDVMKLYKSKIRKQGLFWLKCQPPTINAISLDLPASYEQATRQAQLCVDQALKDNKSLVEIEIPANGIYSVPGDGEGGNEMTQSMRLLREFVSMWERSQQTDKVKIFFPDQSELYFAKKGKGKSSSETQSDQEPVFADTSFRLDYLTKPSPFLDIGWDATKFKASTKVKENDNILIIAYPHFNVNEMLSVWEMYTDVEANQSKPVIITFNGELDRIRTGYYPGLFYPKVGKMAKEFIPQFTQAYYIRNFKGRKPGTLFRAYPGKWQVFRRDMFDAENAQLILSQDDMPSLQEVALNILPNS